MIIVIMTTIAYRNGILAADTLVTERDRVVGFKTKIYKTGPVLWGIAGCLQHFNDMQQWFASGCPCDTPALKTREGAISDAMLVFGRRLMSIDAHGVDHMPLPEFYAIGSGAPYALGAMAHGASAEEAVRAAMKLDLYTGGDVTVLHARGAI